MFLKPQMTCKSCVFLYSKLVFGVSFWLTLEVIQTSEVFKTFFWMRGHEEKFRNFEFLLFETKSTRTNCPD